MDKKKKKKRYLVPGTHIIAFFFQFHPGDVMREAIPSTGISYGLGLGFGLVPWLRKTQQCRTPGRSSSQNQLSWEGFRRTALTDIAVTTYQVTV